MAKVVAERGHRAFSADGLGSCVVESMRGVGSRKWAKGGGQRTAEQASRRGSLFSCRFTYVSTWGGKFHVSDSERDEHMEPQGRTSGRLQEVVVYQPAGNLPAVDGH